MPRNDYEKPTRQPNHRAASKVPGGASGQAGCFGRMHDPTFIVPKSRRWDDVLPGCQIVIVGDFLWLSGKTPRDDEQGEAGGVVGRGDFQAQARQVFRNMREVHDLVGSRVRCLVASYDRTPRQRLNKSEWADSDQ